MLSKLTLIVTHVCNLRCSYCYAEGGDFGTPMEDMSPELSENIIDHFVDKFGGFREIFFFGGEPLVAVETIESACLKAEALHSAGVLEEIPVFTMVTNGTLISDRFIELASRYRFGVTVSMDGDRTIHDLNRRTSNDRGSWDRVSKGIQKLKSAGIEFSIEGTYTFDHWKRGYTPRDVYDYLKTFDPQRISLSEHMTPCSEDGLRDEKQWKSYLSESLDLFEQAAREAFEGDKLYHGGLENMLDSLIHNPAHLKDRFCGAGVDSFAVNPSGMAYPCHMLNNQEPFSLGRFDTVLTAVDSVPGKEEVEGCAECPVRNYCRSCPARMYFQNDKKELTPSEKDCHVVAAHICVLRSMFNELVSQNETGAQS